MKKILLMIIGTFLIGLCSLLGVDEGPNVSKAVRLGFRDENAVEEFNKRVREYGKALHYLDRVGKGKVGANGGFGEGDVGLAREFVEENREFDAKLRKFLSETRKTYGVTILGMALENAYMLGLREKRGNGVTIGGAVKTIKEFRNRYEKIIDESGGALDEIRREAFVRLKTRS